MVLQSKDCHALWVSSKAIEVSMPFPETVDGGIIVRDEVGYPAGSFGRHISSLMPIADTSKQVFF